MPGSGSMDRGQLTRPRSSWIAVENGIFTFIVIFLIIESLLYASRDKELATGVCALLEKDVKFLTSLALFKKNLEKGTHYDSNHRTLWKMQNYGDNKKICGCQELQGAGDEYVEKRGF